jgi:deoxyribodipyrimidine photo-lyase
VGGLHTKGKTYLARKSNIAGYTGGRFAPEGLAKEAPTLDEEPMGGARPLPVRPAVPPKGRIGLLLHEDDLHPESLALAGAEIVAVAGAVATDERSALPVSEPVRAFAAGAMADGLRRAGDAFGAPTTLLPSLTDVCLNDFIRRNQLDAIVTPEAPVGPVAQALAACEARGVSLHRTRRPFDSAAWPHGTRGFFALKERIPDLLREAGIGARDVAQGDLFA